MEQALKKHAKIFLDPLIKFDHVNPNRKPSIMVFHEGLFRLLLGQEEYLRQLLLQDGIPVFYSLERASRSIGKFTRYHEFHSRTYVL